jgi:NAD(P)-dependent dehydrogenase (short-subunit alcohol dehydrogenase family)
MSSAEPQTLFHCLDPDLTTLSPHLQMTGMIERVAGGKEENMAANYPRKRMGQPHQLDSTLLYLVSPSSEFVSGAIIRVDDAQSAKAKM